MYYLSRYTYSYGSLIIRTPTARLALLSNSMGEDNPRKKRWWKKRGHSNPNSLQQPDGATRAASTSEPEVWNITSQLLHFCENILLQPSLHPPRVGTPRRRGLVHKLWDNVFKRHFSARSVQRPPNPTSSVTSSRGQGYPLGQVSATLTVVYVRGLCNVCSCLMMIYSESS